MRAIEAAKEREKAPILNGKEFRFEVHFLKYVPNDSRIGIVIGI
ncbi:hypothetical protein [Bacillus coreaensis]